MKTLILALSLVATNLFAVSPTPGTLTAQELKQLDLTGKFSGKRFQYAADQKSIQQTFIYEFNLKQEGQSISGTSSIINENGDYADMLLRGTIVGDKIHFEEYAIKNQTKPDEKQWCYKSGALSIRKDAFGNIKLIGATPSYIPEYFYACTGGFTDITRTDNTETTATNTGRNTTAIEETMKMTVFPNPFLEKTTISYVLPKDAKVSLEVMDISGKLVSTIENNVSKTAGNYTIGYDKKDAASGIFIAKMTVNGTIYSQQIVQVK